MISGAIFLRRRGAQAPQPERGAGDEREARGEAERPRGHGGDDIHCPVLSVVSGSSGASLTRKWDDFMVNARDAAGRRARATNRPAAGGAP